jgi:dihydrofolate reductase
VSRVVVINHLTLDGVMQSPGRPDEDTRGGFELGGWAGPNIDEVVNAAVGARVPQSRGLVLGRRSYDDMLAYWNTQDSPFKAMLNDAPKYVASRTLREPLPWPNSTLLGEDVAGAVAELKREPGGDLNVMGSGELIQTLIRHDLIDEYLLLIHPLVLGTGRRLFERGGPPTSLRLVESTASTTGVLIATYRPDAAGSLKASTM